MKYISLFLHILAFLMVITGCGAHSEHPQTIKSTTHNTINVSKIDTSFTVVSKFTGAPTSACLQYTVWGEDWLGTINHGIIITQDSDTIFADGWKTEIACESADLLKNAKTRKDSSEAADKRKEDELYYFTHQESISEKPLILNGWAYSKQISLEEIRKCNCSIKDTNVILNDAMITLEHPQYSGFHYSRDPFGDDAPHYVWVPKINKFLCYYSN